MRTAVDSPFVPGSDSIPRVWAGRAAELADWERVVRPRRLAGQYERGRAILGEPGIGKSVLARRIAADAAASGDLVLPSLRIPRGGNPLRQLAGAIEQTIDAHSLGERVGTIVAGLLGRIRAIKAGVTVDVAAPARSSEPHTELTDALVLLCRIARDDGRMVLVHLDEVQNIHDAGLLSQLLVALGDALATQDRVPDVAGSLHERHLPIGVLLTGLTDFTARATSSAGATFARRFQPVPLNYLSDTELRVALAPFTADGWPVLTQEGPAAVTMTEVAVERLLGACLGDPFLFQLAGKAAWAAGTGAVISGEDVEAGWASVRDEALDHAERALERIPPQERQLLEALIALPPAERSLAKAADRLHRRSTDLGAAARRLERRAVITRGKVYTVTARPLEAFLLGDWP